MPDRSPAEERLALFRQIRTAANEALDALAEDDFDVAIDEFKHAIGLVGYYRGLIRSHQAAEGS